ncbi:HET-domain-containing protein [Glonium stellatum]|uniref:HET-domain-containing protein n=1 Tax=Glonium stellatum TaxID=574774 RepID=A0A8E2F010_9PEZI|nr:HET-domain-containing protein [Glonium stellatum]
MSSSTEEFQHTALEGERTIRLVELLPSVLGWSGIQCTLRAVPLQGAPVYEALSYTWGAEEPAHQISCNEKTMIVGPNLFHALGRLRFRTTARLLWIDAICINQKDFKEKNHQIPLMGSIYAQAKRVVIWLGEEADDSSKALALISKLGKIDDDELEDGGRALLFREAPPIPAYIPSFLAPISRSIGDMVTNAAKAFIDKIAPEDSDSELDSDDISILGTEHPSEVRLPYQGDISWKALQAFISRPWFSRIWVIQEVVVAEKALVICGKDTLPWYIIRNAAQVMMSASFPEEAGGRRWMNIVAINGAADMHKDRDSEDEDAVHPSARLHAPKALAQLPYQAGQIYVARQNHHPLLNLLAATLHTDATNPRDKIYGLFGIVESLSGAVPPIPVDYEMPVRDLYRDVTRFLIKEDLTLVVFQMHGLTRKLLDLPSWAIDWSVVKNFGSMIMSFSVAEALSEEVNQASVVESSDPDELILDMKRIGIVSRTGMAVVRDPQVDVMMRSMEVALKDWVDAIVGLPEIKPAESSETKVESFWRTIIANQNGSKDEPPEDYGLYFAIWATRMGLGDLVTEILEGRRELIDAKDVDRYVSDAVWMCTDRRLCVTDTGSLCLAPATTKEGDTLVFFPGGGTPFVLRDHGPFSTLVGPCYIHGFNLVETLKDQNSLIESVVLR